MTKKGWKSRKVASKAKKSRKLTPKEQLHFDLTAERQRSAQLMRRVEQAETQTIHAQKQLHEEQRTHRFYWKSMNGIVCPDSMDEEHLRNAISYVQRRLVHEMGTAVWMSKVEEHARALYEFLKEARRRHIQV